MRHTYIICLIALAAGIIIGWLDVSATEVQGTLLLLMVSAFALSLVTRAPAWSVALSVTTGLPLAHLLSHATGGAGKPQLGMLIAGVPLLVAAYGGRMVGMFIVTMSASVSDEKADPHALTAAQLLGAALLIVSLVGLVPVLATLSARGQPNAWWVATIWQILTFVGWSAGSPRLLYTWRRIRARSATGVRITELGSHATLVLTIAIAHAVSLTLVTRGLFVPLGPATIPQAILWAFAAYLPLDALTYCLIVGIAHAYDSSRRIRQVQGELAAARLATLQAQLRPHFLFNALNAASVLAKRGDAERAGNVLSRLSELLRYVLRGAEATEPPAQVTLGEELTFIERYLAIEGERYSDRLHTQITADDDVRRAIIPHLILQPLVENAMRHGIAEKLAAGLVVVSALRQNDQLVLTVEDDGAGLNEQADDGVGLANTRARLATLYGVNASLTLAGRSGGGAVAQIVMPYQGR